MRKALFCTGSTASSKYFGRAAQTGQAYSSTDRTMLQYSCTSCMEVRLLSLSVRSAYKRLLAFWTMYSMWTLAVISKGGLSSDHCYSYIFVFKTKQNYCKNYASVFGFNPKQIMLEYSNARIAIVNIWYFCPSPTNPYGPEKAGNTRQHEQWTFN